MIDDGKNLEPPAEPFHRVQQPAVFLQFEMQVVAGGHPRASDLPDALPDTDRFTFPYKDPAHVRVQGGVSTPMADMDGPAVTRTVAGGDHPVAGTPAVKGKQDRIVRQDDDRPPQPSFLRSFPRFPDMPV